MVGVGRSKGQPEAVGGKANGHHVRGTFAQVAQNGRRACPLPSHGFEREKQNPRRDREGHGKLFFRRGGRRGQFFSHTATLCLSGEREARVIFSRLSCRLVLSALKLPRILS